LNETVTTEVNEVSSESNDGANDRAHNQENSKDELTLAETNAQTTSAQISFMASEIEELKQLHTNDRALNIELQRRYRDLEQIYQDEQQIQGDLHNLFVRLQQDYHELQNQAQQVDVLNKELSKRVRGRVKESS
jgi:predicted RNase H-like nuclease (RuvC/YqgF family)